MTERDYGDDEYVVIDGVNDAVFADAYSQPGASSQSLGAGCRSEGPACEVVREDDWYVQRHDLARITCLAIG